MPRLKLCSALHLELFTVPSALLSLAQTLRLYFEEMGVILLA